MHIWSLYMWYCRKIQLLQKNYRIATDSLSFTGREKLMVGRNIRSSDINNAPFLVLTFVHFVVDKPLPSKRSPVLFERVPHIVCHESWAHYGTVKRAQQGKIYLVNEVHQFPTDFLHFWYLLKGVSAEPGRVPTFCTGCETHPIISLVKAKGYSWNQMPHCLQHSVTLTCIVLGTLESSGVMVALCELTSQRLPFSLSPF